jgi:hypothetical protein
MGVPPDKFGTYSVPVMQPDRRQAVIMMLFPPEALRDQPLDVIREVVTRGSAGLLETIALEIYKAFTSDPVDGAAARTISEAFAAHADSLRKG